MAFAWIYVGDLLERLQSIKTRDPPYPPNQAAAKTRREIVSWFSFHRKHIQYEKNGEAILSILLPERRTDLVYGIRETSLEKIIARILCLPNTRRNDLGRWREPGAGDLADCVERAQKQAEMPHHAQATQVTVEEVHCVLLAIASKQRFSSPEIRSAANSGDVRDVCDLLKSLYLRLQARESKWLTRLILKNFSPVIIPEDIVYKAFHGSLPDILRIQSSFPAALSLLRDATASMQGKPSSDRSSIIRDIKPVIGIKIGRPAFFKLRSIKHGVEMARGRRMCVEKKYDGEYCQIHIDMSKTPSQRIRIFSKSGKDSTRDRVKIHSVIWECLRLNDPNCAITEKCVLEGELLVYSDKDHKILDFHKIRKHVSRSGYFLGVEQDSQPHDHEHLMIMFFDLLMLDDVPVLNITGNERRKKLEAVVHRIPGRADFAHRRMISFSNIRAAELLREAFAESIRANEEGLIMKPADEPYFDFDGTANFRSCCIKMKKQYIGNFGDVGDFAVVGGAYVASDALKIGIPHLKWTHLFLGCLENKDQVSRWNANPKFVIIAAVTPNADILKAVTRYANPHSVAFDDNDAIELRIEKGVALGKTPSHVFKSPLVFDMRCFGFDKEGNTGFWTLRFPQASKIHFDRDWKDTVSFGELQRLAEASRTDAEYLGDDKSQEDQAWISRLEDADPRGVAVDACTQRSVSLEASLPMVVIPERKGTFLSESEEQCDIQCSGLSPKRISPFVPRTQTPVKRQRLEATFSEIAEKHKKIPKFQSLSQPSPRIPTPLSEITNGYFTNRSDLVASTTRANSSGTPRRKASSFSITSTAIDNTSPKSKRSLLTPSDNLYQKQPTALFPCSEVAMNSSMSVDDIYFAPSTTSFASRILSRPQNLLYTPLPCVTAGQNCSLLNAAVLLAPCIATVPWLVEDLLPSHGVPFTTDPISFLDSSKFPRRCPASKKRIKKIILVESNRRDAMLEFMRNVEHLGTRNKNGHTDKTELIAVYDYRLVESLWKMEKGRACDHDIWKRNSIGSLQTFIAAA